jgi:hypothetical protein
MEFESKGVLMFFSSLNKLILFLLFYFWSFKKYCKFLLSPPIVMKCFPKKQKSSKIW